jgi:hypothetical protein
MGLHLVKAITAAGTAHTNSTDEAVVASYVFPANYFQDGKCIQMRCAVRATATNATDTLTIRIRFGPTTLTGTAVFTSAAIDAVDADICVMDVMATVRDADSSGTIVFAGFASPPDATGTAVVSIAPVPITSLDFTAAQRLEVTADWSVASASNSCQAELFIVTEIV